MLNIKFSKRILFFIFFISGFSALLYQIIWQRWLVFFTGVSAVSISLIVSAFMAGLGIGYGLGGALADRGSQRKQLLYFVLAETGIGLFALFSKNLLYDGLYQSSWAQPSSPASSYLILFGILLFPTVLMGLSLPLLSKSFRLESTENQSKLISNLYFVNTLGAAFGALITGLLLIRWLGFERVVQVGAVLNFVCAGLALFLYQKEKNRPEISLPKQLETFRWNRSFGYWMGQYFLSGFSAICFEIIWFRILDVSIKSISMTFALVLFIYLFSMALGTRVGLRYLSKKNKPGTQLFLRLQFVQYFYSLAVVVLLVWALTHVRALDFLSGYFQSYEPTYQGKILFFTYAIIPFLLMSPPTFLMGFSFSLSQHLVQDRFEEVGRKVGWLQFSNIVGATLGAWLVTLVGFQHLGTSLSIKAISCLGFLYLFILWLQKYSTVLRISLSAGALGLALWMLPNADVFWKTWTGMQHSPMIIKEDETAISAVKIGIAEHQQDLVFVNGLGQSILPIRSDTIHMALGAIPALAHPVPREIAIIGLGSGGTLFHVACRPETQRVDCFEIIANQRDVLHTYQQAHPDPALESILGDPRIQILTADGRFSIQQQAKKYDVIEADALRPKSAYSGNLYSIEYFEILRKKLNKYGIVATWKPTERVLHTFRKVFPHVVLVGDFLLMGSNEPFDRDASRILERCENNLVKNYFKKENILIKNNLSKYLAQWKYIQTHPAAEGASINTDMFPKDEYDQFYLLLDRWKKP
jgi:spermidine synthase